MLASKAVRCRRAGYRASMAVLNVLIERSPEQLRQVLSDGWAYAEWVASTRNIRDADAHWPEPEQNSCSRQGPQGPGGLPG